MLKVSDLWRVAKADGEFYRDKQDERDGQDTVRLIRSINFRTCGGFPVWRVSGVGEEQRGIKSRDVVRA